MELTISIIGASVAVLVSLIGAWFANYNTIRLQTRKLKEQHYFDYVVALHCLITNNEKNRDKTNIEYSKARNILLAIASADVVSQMDKLQKSGWTGDSFIDALTDLIKAIRKRLKSQQQELSDHNVFDNKQTVLTI
ncbi:MAG: hypothetical protein LBV18_01945 [Alistipes sp.]|jgi:hypothetical protein|nr:hypothetical protein [Alistipes sp.]